MRDLNERLVCVDGFSMSVQANQYAYCEPRSDKGPYTRYEVGYPSTPEPLLSEFQESLGRLDPTDDVYPYVPKDVVMAVVQKHGGPQVPRYLRD